ncbi:MAG: flagellar biosynthetic protein FlhB [Candidatus Azotimanducaceae bacterium]|jgi:flagellar biosynthetic protein FlhB
MSSHAEKYVWFALMAEEDSSQEKTEEATTKKLEKAKDEGQVPRSKELNTLVVLVAGSLGLLVFGPRIYQGGIELFAYNFVLDRVDFFDVKQMGIHVSRSSLDALWVVLPIFGLTLLAAILGPVALGGWLMSAKAMAPKMSRMSPLAGLKRMFSWNSLMELAKALGKFLIVTAVAILVLNYSTPTIQLMGRQDIEVAVSSSALTIILAFLLMSLSLIIIAAIDIPFQIIQHANKLKMTLQEVKDEMKSTEGKPEVKGRIRQLQQEMARGRMMSEVPDADVVITNPTHFAVALKYDPANMASPRVVARGQDEVALMIREVGEANGVAIVGYPVLARAIFYSTKLEEHIPEGLYLAVAQVLAYVFQLKQFKRHVAPRPKPLGNVSIPEEFVQMANQSFD